MSLCQALCSVMRIALLLCLVTRTAFAGDICSDTTEPHVKALENVAKNVKGATDDPNYGYDAWCLSGDTKHDARLTKACETILDRDPKNTICLVVLASIGHSMVGTHDIFAWVAAQPLRPWDTNSSSPDYPLYLFKGMGDPRGAKLIVDMWKASIARADALEKKHNRDALAEWSGWRQHAADTLGAIGSADDKAFLDEQAQATKDTHVAQACRDAIAAIASRGSAATRSTPEGSAESIDKRLTDSRK